MQDAINTQINISDSDPIEIPISQRMRRCDAVDWLSNHNNPATGMPYLSSHHVQASEQFIADSISFSGRYAKQQWTQRVDIPRIHYGNRDISTLDVIANFKYALEMLGDIKHIIADICLMCCTLSKAEKKYHIKRGYAKHILRDGLQRLSYIYGFDSDI
jgi:hypothetical protein